jgi:ArsR family transcriptional regulator, arsenate/arsenite/antimonite-responsive transcriptional repressor
MDLDDAVDALSALAQEHRLKVFRLLVTIGPGGLPSGEIARRIGTPANTMSTHLAILTRADIIYAERDSRSIIYRVNPEGVRRIFDFLVADCCGGEPELCAPLAVAAQRALACCAEDDSKPARKTRRPSK